MRQFLVPHTQPTGDGQARALMSLGKAVRWSFVLLFLMPMAPLPTAAQAAKPGPTTAGQPLKPLPFAEAVANAGRKLFSAVPLPPGNGKVEIVVDPLLDGRTGAHTIAAATAGRQLAALVHAEFPRLTIVDFTREALARKPLLLIGTISSLENAGQDTIAKVQSPQQTQTSSKNDERVAPGAEQAARSPAAYSVWFTLADPRTR